MPNPLDAPNIGDASGVIAAAQRIAELERQLREERASFSSQGAIYLNSSIDVYDSNNDLMFHTGPDGTTINNTLYVGQGVLGRSALSSLLRRDICTASKHWGSEYDKNRRWNDPSGKGDMGCAAPVLVRPPHWANSFVFNATVSPNGYDGRYDTVSSDATYSIVIFAGNRVSGTVTGAAKSGDNSGVEMELAGSVDRDDNGNMVFGAGVEYQGITYTGKDDLADPGPLNSNLYRAQEGLSGTITWLANPAVDWSNSVPLVSATPNPTGTLPDFMEEPVAYRQPDSPLVDDAGDKIDWTESVYTTTTSATP